MQRFIFSAGGILLLTAALFREQYVPDHPYYLTQHLHSSVSPFSYLQYAKLPECLRLALSKKEKLPQITV
jgi:hypothetical protein